MSRKDRFMINWQPGQDPSFTIMNPRIQFPQEIVTDLKYRWQMIHMDPSFVPGLCFQHFSKFYHFILKSWRVRKSSKTAKHEQKIFSNLVYFRKVLRSRKGEGWKRKQLLKLHDFIHSFSGIGISLARSSTIPNIERWDEKMAKHRCSTDQNLCCLCRIFGYSDHKEDFAIYRNVSNIYR